MARLAGAGDDTTAPVFVFGLPRSGTTLTERLLDAHPDVAGIGEPPLALRTMQRALSACQAQPDGLTTDLIREAARWHAAAAIARQTELAPDKPHARRVESQPDNYLQAGWLALAFPRAHLVHVQRDPRDVAWSVWSLQFSQLGWTFELEHIAHRIEQHRRVMAHWRELLGERLIELRYEALVAEPEHRLCALLAALGLPWSDAVLRHAQRPAMVRNTSQMQVREPVNAKSVGRWRRYADALMPILPRLSAIATGDDAVAPR